MPTKITDLRSLAGRSSAWFRPRHEKGWDPRAAPGLRVVAARRPIVRELRKALGAVTGDRVAPALFWSGEVAYGGVPIMENKGSVWNCLKEI